MIANRSGEYFEVEEKKEIAQCEGKLVQENKEKFSSTEACDVGTFTLPTLRVYFTDFWKAFDVNTHILPRALRRHFHLVFDDKDPEVCFYSSFGFSHLRYQKSLLVFYTPENVIPDFNVCDYAISSNKMTLGNRHLHLPLCLTDLTDEDIALMHPVTPEMTHRKFCSFIYSNESSGPGSLLRKELCLKLMEYKHVDCPGRVLHNMDAPELAARGGNTIGWQRSKRNFLRKYKFNIAFENSSAPGYITEKLIDCFLGNTVPIYWGSDGDIEPFSRDTLILANDYDSLDSLVKRVVELDENDKLYLRMLEANPLRNGKIIDAENLLASFLSLGIRSTSFAKDPLGFGYASVLFQLNSALGSKGLGILRFLCQLGWRLSLGKQRQRLIKQSGALKIIINKLKSLNEG